MNSFWKETNVYVEKDQSEIGFSICINTLILSSNIYCH